MSEQQNLPPKLEVSPNGGINPTSLADLLEWFLNYDQKVAQIRHPFVEELFQWKQQDDFLQGVQTYPFENAESRFAIGAFQAIEENNSEQKLQFWISDVLNALHEAKQTNAEIAEAYKLETQENLSALGKSQFLSNDFEKRLYLSSCWLESLCTAEARFLGWVYQELYQKPFQPIS